MKCIVPTDGRPGVFSYKSVFLGKRNKNIYKGKILILIDENTQSHGETTAYLLKLIPGAITIGRPTAGSDGQISDLVLPGNYKTYFTGEGILMPDIQMVGLIPDIVVERRIQDFYSDEDVILKKAYEIVKWPFTTYVWSRLQVAGL